MNRVAVGVERARAASVSAAVRRKLAEMGIPWEAIVIEQSDPIMPPTSMCDVSASDCDPCLANPDDPSCQPDSDPCTIDPSNCTDPGTIYPADPSYSYTPAPQQTLGSRFPKLFGGIRIRNYRAVGGTGGACTLGFPALYQNRLVFITNSHCTETDEYTDYSGNFYQPSDIYFPVGRESFDPWKRSSGRRMADAVIVDVMGVDAYVGYIARPTGRYYGATARGDTVVSSQYPWIKLRGEGAPVKDQVFDKIGAKTGWTYGYARKVCYSTTYWECLTFVEAGGDHGDSGAPVLRYYADNTALLVGMLFGGDSGQGFWMNPMSQIRKHFGAMGPAAGNLRVY